MRYDIPFPFKIMHVKNRHKWMDRLWKVFLHAHEIFAKEKYQNLRHIVPVYFFVFICFDVETQSPNIVHTWCFTVNWVIYILHNVGTPYTLCSISSNCDDCVSPVHCAPCSVWLYMELKHHHLTAPLQNRWCIILGIFITYIFIWNNDNNSCHNFAK